MKAPAVSSLGGRNARMFESFSSILFWEMCWKYYVLRKCPIVVQKWRSGTATTEGEVQKPIVTFLPISPKEQSPNVHWVGVEKGNNVWVLVRTHCSWRKGIEKTTLYHWVGCKIHAGFKIIVLGGAGTERVTAPWPRDMLPAWDWSLTRIPKKHPLGPTTRLSVELHAIYKRETLSEDSTKERPKLRVEHK